MSSVRRHQCCRYPRVQSCTLEGSVFTHAQKGQQKLQHFYRGTEAFWYFMRGFLQRTPVWKAYCCWSRQLLRLKPGLSPTCLESCGSAPLTARRPYGAQMMYNSIYWVAWSSDVSLAGKRDNFPLNSSYWQVPVLVFALLWCRAHGMQARVVWRGCDSVTEWWLAT